MKRYLVLVVLICAYFFCDNINTTERVVQDLQWQYRELEQARTKARLRGDNDEANKLNLQMYKLYFTLRIAEDIRKNYWMLDEAQKKASTQLALLYEMENEEWPKCDFVEDQENPGVKARIANNVITVCQQKQETIDPDGRFGGRGVATKLVTAYANLAEFAHIHLDDYPKNKELLDARLDVFACGICQGETWRIKDCEKIVGEAKELLKEALGIEDDENTDSQEIAGKKEKAEVMYSAVRDLCDENPYIEWGNKHYILTTLARGLEAQYKEDATNDEEVKSSDGLANSLHEKLFYKEKQSNQG